MKIIKIGAVWCPGCLVMKRVWNDLKAKYPIIDFEELDYDMDNDLVKSYNSGMILPVHIFFDDKGNELERVIGEVKEEKLIELINKYRK